MQPENQIVQNLVIKQQSMTKNCEFFIERKRRQCKFMPMQGSKFCAAHCSDLQGKIQCPYEKGMFIAASKLEKHLLVCPRIKNRKQQECQQWFNKDVNMEKDKQIKQPIVINHLEEIPQDKLMKVITKVINIFKDNFNDHLKYYLSSTPSDKIQNLTNDHIQAHLLAVEAYNQGLIKDDAIYLEFGAGKGILSYAIANKVKEVCKKKSKNVLLERETRRNKFDRFMKDNYFFQRYRSDVADFDMQTLPSIMAQTAIKSNNKLNAKQIEAELNDLRLIGICKHMCGGALDISVRSLLRSKMSGCIFASCCHHLCSNETYLNTKFFDQNGFTNQEIHIMFKISSWGTKSAWISEQQINIQQLLKMQFQDIRKNFKIIVGRIAKRVIDFGRAKFLKGQLIRYCSDQITPENFVIISSLSQ